MPRFELPEKRSIPFSKPFIDNSEIDAVCDVIKSGWLTSGQKVRAFEEAFSRFVGCRFAIAVNSCTSALHLSLEAIGVKRGDRIITSPMTFAATAEVIRYFDAIPVFIDIEENTLNIDVTKLESFLRKNYRKGNPFRAIIPVHYAGLPCEMDDILDLAKKYNLCVIEDAAHAFPAFYKGRMIGTIGDMTCFSFYATKNITTGEGGMVTTRREDWADRIRLMSLHGLSKSAWRRYTANGDWYYEIIAPGYKYNLTDIAAAIGLAQMKKVEKMWSRRIEIAQKYTKAFQQMDGIEPVHARWVVDPKSIRETAYKGKKTMHSWHLYVIKIDKKYLTLSRDEFIEKMKDYGIGTSVHFIPLHKTLRTTIYPYSYERRTG